MQQATHQMYPLYIGFTLVQIWIQMQILFGKNTYQRFPITFGGAGLQVGAKYQDQF